MVMNYLNVINHSFNYQILIVTKKSDTDVHIEVLSVLVNINWNVFTYYVVNTLMKKLIVSFH